MTTTIQGYKIISQIGKGGMATVYLAIQESLERKVALKVLSPALMTDPSFGQRFLRETRIIANLPHPNIVPVYDAGFQHDQYYLAMELLDGNNLTDKITAGITIKQALHIIHDIADALRFAHQQGFIHRDIKPDNILFKSQKPDAVLSDFGIARPLSHDGDVTITQSVIGSPKFMSPEQALGENLNQQSDLFSLGVVFYLMITGQEPYHARSIGDICIKHKTETVASLPDQFSFLQPMLDKILAVSLQQRYLNATDLIADLDPIIASFKDRADIHCQRPPLKSETQPFSAQAPVVPNPDVANTVANNSLATNPDAPTQVRLDETVVNSQQLPRFSSSKFLSLSAVASAILVIFFYYYLTDDNSISISDAITKLQQSISTTQLSATQPATTQAAKSEHTRFPTPQEFTLYQQMLSSSNNQQQLGIIFLEQHPNSVFSAIAEIIANQQTDLSHILQRAEAGDVIAQFTLGELYDSNIGNLKDKQQAIYWSERASAQHYPLAQVQMALFLLDDQPTASEIDQALQLLNHAVNENFYLAQTKLAELYFTGQFITADKIKALHLFNQAAEQGDAAANASLSQIYLHGYGVVTPDKEKAAHYARLANINTMDTF